MDSDADFLDAGSQGQPRLSNADASSTAGGAGPGSAAAAAAAAEPMGEGADPRVGAFLETLEVYRTKCEGEGNYEEASRCTDQLAAIRQAEAERRGRALRARHVAERTDVSAAHAKQYEDFGSAWERYLGEYDAMATMYVSQMQERHGARLREFQQGLHEELLKKPPRAGREVLEWRSREQQLVKQKLYTEASRVKAVADELERKERSKLDEGRMHAFAGREAKFRATQIAEMQALLKRIESRRGEHTKQWDLDAARLAQRNRNVMAVLEQRQASEEAKKLAEIRVELAPKRIMPAGGGPGGVGKALDTGRGPTGKPPAPQAPSLAAAFLGAGEEEERAVAAAMRATQAMESAAASALAFGAGGGGGGGGAGGNSNNFRSPGAAKNLVKRSQAGVAGSGGALVAGGRR